MRKRNKNLCLDEGPKDYAMRLRKRRLYNYWKNSIIDLQIVNDCNEGARKMERMEEICVLQTQIEFKTKVSK